MALKPDAANRRRGDCADAQSPGAGFRPLLRVAAPPPVLQGGKANLPEYALDAQIQARGIFVKPKKRHCQNEGRYAKERLFRGLPELNPRSKKSKGCVERIAPRCTLSQNGYGTEFWAKFTTLRIAYRCSSCVKRMYGALAHGGTPIHESSGIEPTQ